jgi:hypothetical protein
MDEYIIAFRKEPTEELEKMLSEHGFLPKTQITADGLMAKAEQRENILGMRNYIYEYQGHKDNLESSLKNLEGREEIYLIEENIERKMS